MGGYSCNITSLSAYNQDYSVDTVISLLLAVNAHNLAIYEVRTQSSPKSTDLTPV